MPSPFGKSEILPLYGLVLKTAPFGEANAMYALVDSNLGRIDAGAYGSRSEKSRKRPALMAGNIINGELDHFPQANRYTIREAVCEANAEIRLSDIHTAASLYIILETLNLALPRETPVPYFTDIIQTMGALTRPEPLKYAWRMLCRVFAAEGNMPELPAGGIKLDIFDKPLVLGNGSARFLNDSLKRDGLDWLHDVHLSQNVNANLSSFFSSLIRTVYGRALKSFSLLPENMD